MTIILGLIFLMLLCSFRYNKESKFSNYLSIEATNIIKGVFISFVFLSHFTICGFKWSSEWYDTIGLWLRSHTGQLMVCMFLFYSGYGVMESYKKKKNNYVKQMPKNRILKTLISFDFAVLLYMLYSLFVEHNSFSIKQFVLSLVGWDSYGNSNWYIFCILVLYLITYVILSIFKDRKYIVPIMFLSIYIYTLIISPVKGRNWYNTSFCYAFGCFYSLYLNEIENCIKNKIIRFFLIDAFLLLFVHAYQLMNNMNWYYILTIAFVSLIILITSFFNIHNIVLEWLGKNLFPLYIFQRLPMFFLMRYSYFVNNPYLSVTICAIITVIISILYNIFNKNVLSKIIAKIQ